MFGSLGNIVQTVIFTFVARPYWISVVYRILIFSLSSKRQNVLNVI